MSRRLSPAVVASLLVIFSFGDILVQSAEQDSSARTEAERGCGTKSSDVPADQQQQQTTATAAVHRSVLYKSKTSSYGDSNSLQGGAQAQGNRHQRRNEHEDRRSYHLSGMASGQTGPKDRAGSVSFGEGPDGETGEGAVRGSAGARALRRRRSIFGDEYLSRTTRGGPYGHRPSSYRQLRAAYDDDDWIDHYGGNSENVLDLVGSSIIGRRRRNYGYY